MRKFVIVLKYELKEYFSNKAFMGLTVLLALLVNYAATYMTSMGRQASCWEWGCCFCPGSWTCPDSRG